jgi:serine/threonine protein kinase
MLSVHLPLPPTFTHGPFHADLLKKDAFLGSGAYSQVYRGKNTRSQTDVAVKFVSLDNPKTRNTYYAEARASERLAQQGTFSLHLRFAEQSVMVPGLGVLVMPLLPAQTLETEIRERRENAWPFAVADVLSMGGQLALAVDLLHRHGVAHRDIKAENIAYHGRLSHHITLFDLGLSLMMPECELTAVGQVPHFWTTDHNVGTPLCMSPETMRVGQLIDVFAADMWAVGQVLYAMICLRHQFAAVKTIEKLIEELSLRQPNACEAAAVAKEPVYRDLIGRTLIYAPASKRATAAELGAVILGHEQQRAQVYSLNKA